MLLYDFSNHVFALCCDTRALEVSAEENAARIKRKRCEGSGESCSPADWIRQEDCPVGIRNVGNTCWFSAVIQVCEDIMPNEYFLSKMYCLCIYVSRSKTKRVLLITQKIRLTVLLLLFFNVFNCHIFFSMIYRI